MKISQRSPKMLILTVAPRSAQRDSRRRPLASPDLGGADGTRRHSPARRDVAAVDAVAVIGPVGRTPDAQGGAQLRRRAPWRPGLPCRFGRASGQPAQQRAVSGRKLRLRPRRRLPARHLQPELAENRRQPGRSTGNVPESSVRNDRSQLFERLPLPTFGRNCMENCDLKACRLLLYTGYLFI
jgi:hypothetical protein